jgi:hypothetical protein
MSDNVIPFAPGQPQETEADMELIQWFAGRLRQFRDAHGHPPQTAVAVLISEGDEAVNHTLHSTSPTNKHSHMVRHSLAVTVLNRSLAQERTFR